MSNVLRLCCLVVASLTVLGGCISIKSALFVTQTSLGVDFDSKPPTLSVAYNRQEGYLGPRYANGTIPPVLARIQTQGGVFTAKVRQVYATGRAAEIVAGAPVQPSTEPLAGESKLMFFGTTTTTGLKVGFTGTVPDSFVFGYKRKEFSFIPLGTTKNAAGVDVHVYPSVLATLDTLAQASVNQTAGLQGGQFFATGLAAETYAQSDVVKGFFKAQMEDAFGAYREAVAKQKPVIGDILACYPGVTVKNRPQVWQQADTLQLFFDRPAEGKTLDQLLEAYQRAVDANGKVIDADLLARIDRLYATTIHTPEGFDLARERLLEVHRDTVCKLSSENQTQ